MVPTLHKERAPLLPGGPLQHSLYLPGQQLQFPSFYICIPMHAITSVRIQIYTYTYIFVNSMELGSIEMPFCSLKKKKKICF